MKIQTNVSMAGVAVFGVVLVVFFGSVLADDAFPAANPADMVVEGGPLYMAWPETDSFMTCALSLVAPANKVSRRKPVQIILLVDVSRSMQGEPLGFVRQAARATIESLQDGDMFGIIAFSTFARIAFPLQPLTPGVRPAAHNAAAGLGDEDRRNTLDGIKKAIEQFDLLKNQDAIGRHLFLITNGDANYGVMQKNQLLREALSLTTQFNVSVSTFGFKHFDRGGDNFDEDVLSGIARQGHGRFYFIDTPQDIPSRISEEIQRVCTATARQVTVWIEPPGRLSRITNVEGAIVENDSLFIGDMAPGSMRVVFFDIEGRPKRQTDCKVTVVYQEADRSSEREARAYIDLPLASGATQLNARIAPRVIMYDLQASLVETAGQLAASRQDYTIIYRDKLKEIEQENVILNSEYIRASLAYYERFERILTNSAVETSVVVKTMKYHLQQLLYGQ